MVTAPGLDLPGRGELGTVHHGLRPARSGLAGPSGEPGAERSARCGRAVLHRAMELAGVAGACALPQPGRKVIIYRVYGNALRIWIGGVGRSRWWSVHVAGYYL